MLAPGVIPDEAWTVASHIHQLVSSARKTRTQGRGAWRLHYGNGSEGSVAGSLSACSCQFRYCSRRVRTRSRMSTTRIVVDTQVYMKTKLGTRITDILAIDPSTLDPMFGIEVKANSATRTPLQRAKDLALETTGGEVRSWRKTVKWGTHLKYRTYVWCMDMPSGTLNCPVDQQPSSRPVP